MEELITIYTDGACNNNGGYYSHIPVISSYGYVILNSKNEILHEHIEVVENKTNNQMELTAIIESLKKIKEFSFKNCILYSDSAYSINSIKVKKLKKNVELVRELQNIYSMFDNVKLEWVKGHSDNFWNNYIDEKITDAARKFQKI